MSKSKLDELAKIGQSIWLDNINRSMIENGKLKEEINRGLRGMTSNPSIFDNSISSSTDYDGAIKKLAGEGKSTFEIYDDLTVRDVQDAADMFMPVYEKTYRLDGYVSLEINPELAMKTKETIEEGRRLFKKVNRPNVMFKVPSTDAGYEAITAFLGEGINVNATLIFSMDQYIKTALAYIEGMKRLSARGGDMSKVHSVASVFVSRIDSSIDKMIDARSEDKRLKSFRGKAAVANSKMIFSKYHDIFSGDDFLALKNKGANLQRVLWGSTGTKDPSYSDVKYVTELIGNPTVNTIPDKTLAAFMDHGVIKESITKDAGDAEDTIESLKEFNIDVNEICLKLLDEGVTAFQKSFSSLLNAIETKKR
jgi:transaldolase